MSSGIDKVYVGYVGYYIKNMGQQLPDDEWRMILKDLKNKKESWKKLALKLYYIHFISLSLKLDVDELIRSDKSIEDLRKTLVASDEFRKDYDLPELPVVHYTTNESAIKHMKKFHAPESVIDDIMEGEKVVSKSTKTTKSKAAPKSKATKATTTESKAIVPAKGKDVKIPTFLTVKQGRKTVTLTKREDIIKHLTGVSPQSKAQPAKKTCDNYTLVELRKMAQEKNIEGRSKMKKVELCKALKIKI
jgi:hypothetical protein